MIQSLSAVSAAVSAAADNRRSAAAGSSAPALRRSQRESPQRVVMNLRKEPDGKWVDPLKRALMSAEGEPARDVENLNEVSQMSDDDDDDASRPMSLVAIKEEDVEEEGLSGVGWKCYFL